MLIHNNKGEVIGEMNMSITQDGDVINTNTLYNNGSPVTQNISTVLAAGFTNTAVLEKFGLDPKTMPMKPLSVEQCVSEGLSGLLKNRSRIVPGRLNRILNALVPASLARKMEADLLGKGLANKSAPAIARAEA